MFVNLYQLPVYLKCWNRYLSDEASKYTVRCYLPQFLYLKICGKLPCHKTNALINDGGGFMD